MIGNIILGLCFCLDYSIALFVLPTIWEYLEKKPLGLQSVLDLLIIDLVRVYFFKFTFWMGFLFTGFFHGELPTFAAEFIIFILLNLDGAASSLFQNLVIAKFLLIFKGN